MEVNTGGNLFPEQAALKQKQTLEKITEDREKQKKCSRFSESRCVNKPFIIYLKLPQCLLQTNSTSPT